MTVSFISQCFTDFLIAIARPLSWHWVCFCLQWEQERPPSHQKANCSKSGDYTLKPPPPVSPNPPPRKLHSIILSLYMIKCCSAKDRLLSREEKKNKFLSCGLSRLNLCMPFIYSDWSCQTLTYTCTDSHGCHRCWPWDWLKRLTCVLIWYKLKPGGKESPAFTNIYIKKHLFTWDDCTFTHIYLQTDDLL